MDTHEPFVVEKVHSDWDGDELLFERTDGRAEDMWRLDFVLGESDEYQAQLFLLTELKEDEWVRRCEEGDEDTKYVSARLFIERDNRIPREEGGDGERWDYACDCWPITPAEALALLAKSKEDAVVAMGCKVEDVQVKPNDRAFISSQWREGWGNERTKVEAKWKREDTKKWPSPKGPIHPSCY